MKKIGCFAICIFVFGCSSALASDLTLFGGYQRTGKINLQNSARGVAQFPFSAGNFGTMGLRLGIGKDIFGGESTFAYSSNFIDSSAKAFILNEDLVLQLPLPAVKPYGTAGLGTVITKGSGFTDIGAKFAVNYGGGLKLALAGPLGGRLDVRGYTIRGIQSQTLNVLEVSLGVVFFF